MDTAATPSRISRVDLRFRPRALDVPLNEERETRLIEKEEDLAREALDEEQGERAIMGRNHRIFHRRAAQPASQVVTVSVEVVATVDTNGLLLAQETRTQALMLPTTAAPATVSVPSVLSIVAQAVPSTSAVIAVSSTPAVKAVSSVRAVVAAVSSVSAVPEVSALALPSVPSVPSVPPFPSNLVVPSVPAYPWPSGVSVAEAAATTNPATSTPVPISGTTSSVVPASLSVVSQETNSATVSSRTFSSTSSSTSLESTAPSSSPSTSQSSDLSGRPSSSDTAQSKSGSTATASDATAPTYYGGGGGPGNPAAPPAATTAAVAAGNTSSSPAPLQTPQVVGSVVGSLAGAALILAVILLLIRRHKRRRGGVLQLTNDDTTNINQPMSQAPPSSSLVPSAFLHRFSGMSRSTVDTSTSGGERSFQRVSGRKLPSAFSEGMTSEQFSRGGTMSGSSFYQDDQGTYGGPGVFKEFGKEIDDTPNFRGSGPMNIRPSPARTPIIRHPDDAPPFGTSRSHLSPPQSPNSDFEKRGTLGRSLSSADGSRSSRFKENV